MRTWAKTGLLEWQDKNGDGMIQYYNDGADAQAKAAAQRAGVAADAGCGRTAPRRHLGGGRPDRCR